MRVLVAPYRSPTLTHTTGKVAVLTNARTHTVSECVDELKLQVELLEAEKAQLQATCDGLRKENDNLRTAPWQARKFSIERVKDDYKLVSFYTGFSSYLMFLACFNFLKRSAEVMRG